jgi:FkbM family methyltransferase
MKQWCFGFFTALLLLFSVQELRRYQKQQRKLAPKVSEISMRLPVVLPFDQIHGYDVQKMTQMIKEFPASSYRLISSPQNGSFYLDAIPDLIKDGLRNGHVWEPHMQQIIKKYARQGSTVLDIGAHIGTHALQMAQAVGSDGRLFVFEPQPKIFRELFLNMTVNGLSNVSFFWAGAGDHNGTIELSPLASGNEGGTPLFGGMGEKVQLLTIDSLNLSNVSFMKIDVEGMENQVIDGARETILANRPVIAIEIMGGHEFGSASKEVRAAILHTIGKLEDLGYSVSQIQGHDWLALPTLTPCWEKKDVLSSTQGL